MFRAQIQVPAAAIFAALSNLRLAFSVNDPCKENTAAVTATTLPEIRGLRSRRRRSRGLDSRHAIAISSWRSAQDRGGALERRQCQSRR